MSFFGLGKRAGKPLALSQPDHRELAVAAAIESSPEPEPLNATPQRSVNWRVLFLGADPLWFRQTERDILCLQPNWLCQLAKDSAKASQMLTTHPFDALIIETAVADRVELLNRIQKRAENLICLARCNLSERLTVAQCHAVGITPVPQDEDTAALVSNLKRAEQLQEWLSNPAIKKLLPQLKALPTAPELYIRISQELRSPNSSIADIAQLISQEPIMSAKILQVVNSAFFGLTQEITDTHQAVMVMGVERVRSLILLTGIFSQYDASKCPGFSVESVWNHSLQTGIFARAIAVVETKDGPTAEAAFTAGLLHDIGKLVLAGNLPQMYATVRRLQTSKELSCHEAEMMTLGISLPELGASLLGTWRLPLAILEAIAWHQRPQRSKDTHFSLLTAVHVANVLTQERQKQSAGEIEDGGIDGHYLQQIGVTDDGNSWRALCGLDPKSALETLANRVRHQRESQDN